MTEIPVLDKISLTSDVEGNRFLRLDWSNDRHQEVAVFKETEDGVASSLRRAARVIENNMQSAWHNQFGSATSD